MLNKLFRYASLLMAAVMLFSCTGTVDPEDMNGDGTNIEEGNGNDNGGSVVPKVLQISADKKYVQTFDGDFITLTVTLGEEVITEGVTFYDDDDNVLPIEDFKFMTETAGEYKVYAEYGTYFTEQPVTVTAIAVAIPETPEDPNPDGTNFQQRVLITQFTTTGCTWCPQMKLQLKGALTEEYAEKVVKVDCHSSTMQRNDPAYVDLKPFEEQCDALLPSINLDLSPETSGYYSSMVPADIQAMIDRWYNVKEGIAAGIAVNSVATDNQIVAKVTVKAAQTASYRVGLMLLEDNIKATASQSQQGTGAEEWMNTHNSCIRYMDARSGTAYYGHPLGEIAAGETEEHIFIMDLAAIWDRGMLKAEQNGCQWASSWVSEELHLAVFVTTVGTDGKNEFYFVSNVVDCPINDVTPFQYK